MRPLATQLSSAGQGGIPDPVDYGFGHELEKGEAQSPSCSLVRIVRSASGTYQNKQSSRRPRLGGRAFPARYGVLVSTSIRTFLSGLVSVEIVPDIHDLCGKSRKRRTGYPGGHRICRPPSTWICKCSTVCPPASPWLMTNR